MTAAERPPLATRERWRALLQRTAPRADPDRSYDQLAAHYGDPGRHYHTLTHIAACLADFDASRTLAHRPDAVELALWTHDVIYDSRSAENEAQSADWAAVLLEAGGADPDLVRDVRRLVLATRHAEPAAPGDGRLIADIDLAVLGASAPEFDAYEGAIRREYAWVPEPDFRRGRAAVLSRLLAWPRIYGTAGFYDRLETAARRNLERSLARLRNAG
jgi:predicted metal-dependent HD superfamily phosphohydrolase